MFQLLIDYVERPVVLIPLTILFIYSAYRYLIYPTFLSPLAKIPNVHFTSPFCSLWITFKYLRGGTGVREISHAHKKLGPVVQISPEEISVCSLDGLRKVYAGGFEKTAIYHEFQHYGTPNLVSTLHNKPHATQKRMISNVYSKSYVQSSSDLTTLSRVLLHDRLFPVLEQAARTGANFDAYLLNHALGADFMNAYLFGTLNGTDFIRDTQSLKECMEPFRTKFRILPGHEKAGKLVEKHIMAMCEAAEGVSPPPYKIPMSLPPTNPVVYSQLLSKLAEKGWMLSSSPARTIAASEMTDEVAAAIETTRVALTYTQWELSRRPELCSALRKELLTLSPPLKYDANSSEPLLLPDSKDIDSLPLLNAILKEVLRLYTPSPVPFPRITPPEGVIIDGYAIPGGISVAAAAHCLHRNEEVFPDAESFKPERWFADNTGGVDGGAGPKSEQNKWYWPFGSGARMCIGSHYAVYVLKLCIAAMYTNYSATIIDDEGIEPEDAFIAGPKGEKLILRFHSYTTE